MRTWTNDNRIWRGTALVAVAAGLWLLKRHYADSSVDRLVFILAPTAKLVSVATGVGFDLESGIGYLSHDHYFAIAKPCAGINFMVAAGALLGLVFSRRVCNIATACLAVVAAFGVAYAASIIVNATRIVLAMPLAQHPLASHFWTAGRVHRALGIAVYFGGLALLQLAAIRATADRRCPR
jgi:exosortase K